MMTQAEKERLTNEINAAFEADRERIASLEAQVEELMEALADKKAPAKAPANKKAA